MRGFGCKTLGFIGGRAEDETVTWKPQQSERSKLRSWNLGKCFESAWISRGISDDQCGGEWNPKAMCVKRDSLYGP